MLISGKHPHKEMFSGNLLRYELAFLINVSIRRILRGLAIRNVFGLHLLVLPFFTSIYDFLAELLPC